MIAQTNAFIVVLATCVLAPMPLCHTLLRLAEDPAFYMPRWSAGILDELRRVLRRMEYSEGQAGRRITAMQTAFEDACVTGYAEPIPSMTNDEKDRHVLAAAVRAGAHAILTENGKHFPAKSVEPYDIDVLTPDRFLAHQFHLNPELLEEKLCGQAKARGIPYDGLVHRLAKWAVIGFRDRRRGIVAALAMFVLGTLLEGGQRFSPGRAVEFGDVIANGAGVSCGTLLGLPIRACIAIL